MNKRSSQRGIVTLELLIALVLLAGVVFAVVALVFYCQTLIIDGQNNHTAILKAEKNLEDLRALSRVDFNAVIATTTIADATNIYNTENEVSDFPCQKQVANKISWTSQASRPEEVELATELVDLDEKQALGLDCDSDVTEGDWQHPTALNSANLNPSGPQVTGTDVLNKLVFVSAQSSNISDPDLYVFNSDGAPTQLYSLDTGPGLNAVDVMLHSDGNYYIYAASTSTAQQLQVIKFPRDLSSPPVLVAAIGLPGVAGSFPQGRSIFYYDGKVYVATHRTAGKELQVYDVSAGPGSPVWKGSLEINHNINALAVKKQTIDGSLKTLAYLATSGNSKDLIVVDVTDPSHMSELVTASQDLPGNEDAKSIYVLANKAYLGRYKSSVSTHADFYILDISTPNVSVSILDSKNLHANDINSIRVSGDLAFVASGDTASGLQIINISSSTIKSVGNFNLSEQSTGLDLESNLIYATSLRNNALRIIKPGP